MESRPFAKDRRAFVHPLLRGLRPGRSRLVTVAVSSDRADPDRRRVPGQHLHRRHQAHRRWRPTPTATSSSSGRASSQDGSHYGVFAQRFSSAGRALGGEFQVNTYTTGVPALPVGRRGRRRRLRRRLGEQRPGRLDYGVFARASRARARRSASEFQVNTYTDDYQTLPVGGGRRRRRLRRRLGELPARTARLRRLRPALLERRRCAGRRVPGQHLHHRTTSATPRWRPTPTATSSSPGRARPGRLELRRLRPPLLERGRCRSAASSRSTPTPPAPRSLPSVAIDADGDFVVVWASDRPGRRRRTASSRAASRAPALALGGEFQVNAYTADGQSAPAVAIDADGDFVVDLESDVQDGSSSGVFARRFSSAGGRAGRPSSRSTPTPPDAQRCPSVAADADGDFVVAWQSDSQDGDGYGVFAQRFAALDRPRHRRQRRGRARSPTGCSSCATCSASPAPRSPTARSAPAARAATRPRSSRTCSRCV